MAEKKKKWIKKATEDKGALHRNLGVKEGEKIPEGKLKNAEHSENPKIRKEAALAETLKGMHHGKKKPSTGGIIGKMYGKPKSKE